MTDQQTITTIHDLGYEYIKIPITHSRVHRVNSKWLVEYKLKARFVIDGLWWFNDGVYVEYNDAAKRAQFIVERGYVRKMRYKKAFFTKTKNKEEK